MKRRHSLAPYLSPSQAIKGGVRGTLNFVGFSLELSMKKEIGNVFFISCVTFLKRVALQQYLVSRILPIELLINYNLRNN